MQNAFPLFLVFAIECAIYIDFRHLLLYEFYIKCSFNGYYAPKFPLLCLINFRYIKF